ncbi:hypothetical protein NMY22_g10657 [Coprinellus aureogranulatus]|nr:hypothetical protein NMY22_g10657 [Coprinellus aureogranulatus]
MEVDMLELAASLRTMTYVDLSLYTIYTMTEEVRCFFPQRWNIGKIIFLTVRYGICLHIMFVLPSMVPIYHKAHPLVCKGLFTLSSVAEELVVIAYNGTYRASLVSTRFFARSNWTRLCATLCSRNGTSETSLPLANNVDLPGSPSHRRARTRYVAFENSIGSRTTPFRQPWLRLHGRAEVWTDALVLPAISGGVDRGGVSGHTVSFLAIIVTLLRHYRGHDIGLVSVMRRDGVIYFLTAADWSAYLLFVRDECCIYGPPSDSDRQWKIGIEDIRRCLLILTNRVFILYDFGALLLPLLVNNWTGFRCKRAKIILLPILVQRLMINMLAVSSVDASSYTSSALVFASLGSELELSPVQHPR